jgi:hypothetical protein
VVVPALALDGLDDDGGDVVAQTVAGFADLTDRQRPPLSPAPDSLEGK